MAPCGTCRVRLYRNTGVYSPSPPRSGHPRQWPGGGTLDSQFLYHSHQMAHQSPHYTRTDNAAAAPSWPCSGPACPPPRLLAPDTPEVRMPSVFVRTDGAPAPAVLRGQQNCSAALSPPDSEYRPRRDRNTLFPLISLSAHQDKFSAPPKCA